MHIEIFKIRIQIKNTGQILERLFCYEVGESEYDRKELVEKLKFDIEEQLEFQSYRCLSYISRKIYPKDE